MGYLKLLTKSFNIRTNLTILRRRSSSKNAQLTPPRGNTSAERSFRTVRERRREKRREKVGNGRNREKGKEGWEGKGKKVLN